MEFESKKKKSGNNNNIPNKLKNIKGNTKKSIITWQKEAEKMNYEESLSELELILGELQNDQVSLNEIKESYLKGNIYLKHCEELLNEFEQEVVELKVDETI